MQFEKIEIMWYYLKNIKFEQNKTIRKIFIQKSNVDVNCYLIVFVTVLLLTNTTLTIQR